MRGRPVLAAVAAALALLAPPADASASCVVATDPAGDANATPGPTVNGDHVVHTPADPAFDLHALRITAGRGELRAELTVGRSDAEEPVFWSVSFGNDESRWTMRAARHFDGTYFGASGPDGSGYVSQGGSPARGEVDAGRGRVVVVARAADLSLGPTSRLTWFRATSQRTVGYANGGPAGRSSAMTPYPLDELAVRVAFRLDRGCGR